MKTTVLLKRFLPCYRKYWKTLLFDLCCAAFTTVCELVQHSLEQLAHGRTVFTIAHRLTTIRVTDMIWALTENGVEEMGTHQELMEKGGLYARMYRMYTTDQSGTRAGELFAPAAPKKEERE